MLIFFGGGGGVVGRGDVHLFDLMIAIIEGFSLMLCKFSCSFI